MFLHCPSLHGALHPAPDPSQLPLQPLCSLQGFYYYHYYWPSLQGETKLRNMYTVHCTAHEFIPQKFFFCSSFQVLGQFGWIPLFDTAFNLMCELCPNQSRYRWPNSLSLIQRELVIGIACTAWSIGEMGMPLLGELKILNYSLQYLRLVLSFLEVDQDSFSDSSFCLLRLLEADSRVAKMAGLQVENERGSGDLVKDCDHEWRSCARRP